MGRDAGGVGVRSQRKEAYEIAKEMLEIKTQCEEQPTPDYRNVELYNEYADGNGYGLIYRMADLRYILNSLNLETLDEVKINTRDLDTSEPYFMIDGYGRLNSFSSVCDKLESAVDLDDMAGWLLEYRENMLDEDEIEMLKNYLYE